jgi:optic atrophy 3 protein
VKTLAKPVSNRIKKEFSRLEFTQNILVSVGQGAHNFTNRLSIWSSGYKVRSIPPLERNIALQNGAEVVGETFVFGVSFALLIYEVNRSKAADERKNAIATEERHALQAKLNTLDIRLVALEEVVASNSRSILAIGGERYQPPDKAKLVPIDDTTLTSAESSSTTLAGDPTQSPIPQPDPTKPPQQTEQEPAAGSPMWLKSLYKLFFGNGTDPPPSPAEAT